MLNSSSPVPAAGKTRLPQRFLGVLSCLLLAAMLLALPALAAASTLADDLSALSDDELLLLKQLIDAEVEARGLVVSADGMSASDEPLVWIPKSGSKYHSKSTCSNMKNPLQVTLSEAKDGGYEPCKKCRPPV